MKLDGLSNLLIKNMKNNEKKKERNRLIYINTTFSFEFFCIYNYNPRIIKHVVVRFFFL